MEHDRPVLRKRIHPAKSSVHTRRNHGGSCRCMHSIHDPTVENASLEEIRRGLRVQLSITHYRHHCISPAYFQPKCTDHGLHLRGNSLYRYHANSSQLLAHLRDDTELATNHQQPEHALRRYGGVDVDGIQLQLEFELRYPHHGRTPLISQRKPPQQSGKRPRHGSTETLEVQGERQR